MTMAIYGLRDARGLVRKVKASAKGQRGDFYAGYRAALTVLDRALAIQLAEEGDAKARESLGKNISAATAGPVLQGSRHVFREDPLQRRHQSPRVD